MSGKNWQGRDGLSSDCELDGMIVMALLMSGEHPCDRCNMDRESCRGYDPKPGACSAGMERNR